MAEVRYHQYIGELWEDLNLEDLVGELSDFLLQSGFGEEGQEWDEDSLQALHDAILEALMRRGLLSDDDLQKLMGDADALEQFLQKTVERMVREGYLKTSEGQPFHDPTDGPGGWGKPGPPVRFELTEKGVDFLGYKTPARPARLAGQVLPRPPRHARPGHRRRGLRPVQALRVRRHAEPRRQRHAALRGGARGAARCRSTWTTRTCSSTRRSTRRSCATVVMLDCSHSMILYGEDRFTPAKKVALALSHLIRTQYPGDSLQLVVFHDSAEEVPLSQLAKVRVGPHYTNTREGLRLAQRILSRQRKDMKQIVMITDGKPSALTEADGRIYRNPFGLDPRVVSLTLKEVADCRRQGIMVNTFMLARDYELVAFVKKVCEMSRGKAYFTTPYTLGQFILMDYLNKKTRTVH